MVIDAAQAAECPDTEAVISLQLVQNLRGIEEALQMGSRSSGMYELSLPLPDL